MPLPTPKKGERQDAFMSRCMRSKVIQKDFASQEQQLAVCFSQLREKRGKSVAPPRAKRRASATRRAPKKKKH